MFSCGLNVIDFSDFKRFRLNNFLKYQLPLQFKLYIWSEKFHKATLLEFQNLVGNFKNLQQTRTGSNRKETSCEDIVTMYSSCELGYIAFDNYSHPRTKSAIPLGECFLCLANAPQINTATYKCGADIQCGAIYKSLKISTKMLVVGA